MSQLEPEDFPEANVLLGKGQNEYNALPAFLNQTIQQQPMVFCWKLTPEQLGDIARTGYLWHTVWTFGAPFQPMILQTDSPFEGFTEGEIANCYTDHREVDKAIAVCLHSIMNDPLAVVSRPVEDRARELLKLKGLF